MDDIFKEFEIREEKLFLQLSENPICELTGIVDTSGVGASQSRGDDMWSLLFTFDAWKIENGPLRKESLTVRRIVSKVELEKYQELIDSETIIKIKARVSVTNVFDSPQALLEQHINDKFIDSELQNHLLELQKPIVFKDTVLGEFIFDRKYGWYTSKVNWNGKTIELNINVEEPNDLQAGLILAHSLFENVTSWSQRISNYAVQELLPLKNDTWLEDDELELTSEDFLKRMKLESISLYLDGEFEFWHDDGDLFYGHSIQISGNIEEGPKSAKIPG